MLDNRERIEEIALSREVPFLVHFTRAKNIPSIMQHGLLPISVAHERGINPLINDQQRLDGRLNGTSVSVAFPNEKMFYGLRKGNPDIDWAILKIETNVVWLKEAIFCKHNAATQLISGVLSDNLSKPAAFEAMFEEIEGHESRLEQSLQSCDPTDVQGEIMIMEAIEPEFIFEAIFNDKKTKNAFSSHFGGIPLFVHAGKKGLFANRTYYRNFGGG